MVICQPIYQQIDQYLAENGITQKFVSDKTGLEQNKLSMMLSGKRKISADEYLAICNALKKSPRYFVDKGKEKKNENEVILTSTEGNT